MAALITIDLDFCFLSTGMLSKELPYCIQDKIRLKRFSQLLGQHLHGEHIFYHKQITELVFQLGVYDIRQQNFSQTLVSELFVDMVGGNSIFPASITLIRFWRMQDYLHRPSIQTINIILCPYGEAWITLPAVYFVYRYDT